MHPDTSLTPTGRTRAVSRHVAGTGSWLLGGRRWRAIGRGMAACLTLWMPSVFAFGPPLLPTTTEAPEAVVAETREIRQRIDAATKAGDRGAARQAVERIVERESASRQVWLIPAWNEVPLAVTTAVSDPASDAAADAAVPLVITASDRRLLWPLDRWCERMRWRLVVAADHAGNPRDGGLEPVRLAAAAHDLEELARLARGAVDADVLVEALRATGSVAAERGWLTAAREAWQEALERARDLRQSAVTETLRGRLAWLGQVASQEARPAMPHDHHIDDRFPGRGSLGWSLKWTRIQPGNHQGSDGPRQAPVVTDSLAGRGPLVVWQQSGEIHARRLADGASAWSARGSQVETSRIFPPSGFAPPATRKPPASDAAMCVWSERLVACLTVFDDGLTAGVRDSALRLVCLDLGEAAEGRLVWETPLPVDDSVSRGVSLAVTERIVCLLRGGDAPWLAAFRLHDGQPLWQRSLALASRLAAEQPFEACLAAAEDLIVVAVSDGSVWAIDHDGRVCWVSTPSPPMAPLSGSPKVAVAGGVVVVSHAGGQVDQGMLEAFELRGGSLRWRRDRLPSTTLVGITGSVVVAEEGEAIVSRSIDDGAELARRVPDGWRRHGDPAVSGSGLAWPVVDLRRQQAPLRISRLAPATLVDIGEPIVLREPGGPAALALAQGSLVVADAGSITVVDLEGAGEPRVPPPDDRGTADVTPLDPR